MILVDTSVWIDFFNGKDLPHVETLESLISQEADIVICGLILTEVLQGISNDKEHKLTQTYFAGSCDVGNKKRCVVVCG